MASICSSVFANGSSLSNTDKYRYGLCSLARAVSIKLKIRALASAPLGVSLKRKFFLISAIVFATCSDLIFEMGNRPSVQYCCNSSWFLSRYDKAFRVLPWATPSLVLSVAHWINSFHSGTACVWRITNRSSGDKCFDCLSIRYSLPYQVNPVFAIVPLCFSLPTALNASWNRLRA